MPNWEDIIVGTGRFFGALANGNIINEWLAMEETDALNSIEEFVRRVPLERVDAMDVDFLNRCNIEFVPSNRTQLIKFYAFFKLIEYVRFQKFRGFPQ